MIFDYEKEGVGVPFGAIEVFKAIEIISSDLGDLTNNSSVDIKCEKRQFGSAFFSHLGFPMVKINPQATKDKGGVNLAEKCYTYSRIPPCGV